jgi:hypothetical protein
MRRSSVHGRAALGLAAALVVGSPGCGAHDTSSRSAAGPAEPALLDSPAWPADGKLVKLAWVVPPSSPDPAYPDMESMVRRDLQLIVRVGNVERRLVLAASGPLLPEHQKACGAAEGTLREPGDLATIQFGRGSFGGYAVRKDSPTSIAVHSWSWDDGGCPDEKGDAHPCPRESTVVRRVQVPASATFEETLEGVDAAGGRHPFSCESAIE